MKAPLQLRLAEERDVPRLEALIPRSVRALHAPFHPSEVIARSIGPVFGVDTQLIRDRTYFVVEADDTLAGGGGWSRRLTVYGGDRERPGEDPVLDPAVDAARIRAFFVAPEWARQGVGSWLLAASEKALQEAGFRRARMVATLAGEQLYARHGYQVDLREEIPLGDGLVLPVVHLSKSFAPP